MHQCTDPLCLSAMTQKTLGATSTGEGILPVFPANRAADLADYDSDRRATQERRASFCAAPLPRQSQSPSRIGARFRPASESGGAILCRGVTIGYKSPSRIRPYSASGPGSLAQVKIAGIPKNRDKESVRCSLPRLNHSARIRRPAEDSNIEH